MSTTNETNTQSDFSKAWSIIKSYTEVSEHLEVDRAYSRVVDYYTHPSSNRRLPAEFVREVLDSLEENLTTYGPAEAEVATLYPYI